MDIIYKSKIDHYKVRKLKTLDIEGTKKKGMKTIMDEKELMECQGEIKEFSSTLKNVFEIFMSEATKKAVDIMNSEVIQEGSEIVKQISGEVLVAIKILRVLQKIADLPTLLFMDKFRKYCEGISDIPLEKRRKYIDSLGKDKFNKETVFVFNVINKIEEHDKISFFIKLSNG